MKSKLLLFIALLIISGCKSSKDITLIKVKNKLDSKIYIELWGYPAEGYQNNKAGAFHGILYSDSSFIIELKDSKLYQKTYDISPVYDISENDGFEILIYQPVGDKIIFYGDTPKDTLYNERCDLKELIINSPKIIIVK